MVASGLALASAQESELEWASGSEAAGSTTYSLLYSVISLTINLRNCYRCVVVVKVVVDRQLQAAWCVGIRASDQDVPLVIV